MEGKDMRHQPVMVDQVLLFLGNIRSGIIIDGTLGMGGHAEAILMATPETVSVVGIDRDASAIRAASDRLAGFHNRFTAIHGSYRDYIEWKDKLPHGPILGFLLDLGLSSVQLDTSGTGFLIS